MTINLIYTDPNVPKCSGCKTRLDIKPILHNYNCTILEKGVYQSGITKNSILIFPDKHGDIKILNDFLIRIPSFNWIAIEMFHVSKQYYIDRYLKEKNVSIKDGLWKLILPSDSWSKFKNNDNTPYRLILDIAQLYDVRVIALEVISYREYCSKPIGDTLEKRNKQWVNVINTKTNLQNGAIFGGSSHFLINDITSVFTLLKTKKTDIFIFSEKAPQETIPQTYLQYSNHF